MAVRQLMAPVDLRQSLPDPTQINPGQYDEAIRRRFDSIQGRGSFASAITARDAQNKMQQAYQNRLQGLTAATPTVGGGAPIKWDGKKWISPAGNFKYAGQWGKYPGSGKEHNALDFLTPMGSNVYMPYGGTVVTSGWDNGGFGNSIRVKFDNGTYGIFGHLSKLLAKQGQRLTPGALLALSGSSGRSTGPHLHYEMRTSLYDPSTAFDYRYLFGW